ncbi:MAG: hypothetical protein Q8P57_00865 [Candidatus Pacearchaeota archaeon]|nr:hypothetical protein [Candidatus Pacearchaeota archaeon]
MLVKILGIIDFVASILLLMMTFGLEPFIPLMLFSAGLLLLKGMFIFTGDVLSVIDLISGGVLIIAIFFSIPSFLLWTPAFLLMAKGFVSFF